MTGFSFWSIFLSICSSTASRMTFAWSAKSCSRSLVCSESSFSSRASETGLKFWVFLDWDLGMENKTGRLTLLSISGGEKLSKESCGFQIRKRKLKAAATIQDRHDPSTAALAAGCRGNSGFDL